MYNEYFHVVTESSFIQSCTLSFIVHTEKKETTLMQVLHEVAACKISRTMETEKLSGQKVVTIGYERWLFTSVEVLNCRALTGKVMVVWMGGRTWRFNCS